MKNNIVKLEFNFDAYQILTVSVALVIASFLSAGCSSNDDSDKNVDNTLAAGSGESADTSGIEADATGGTADTPPNTPSGGAGGQASGGSGGTTKPTGGTGGNAGSTPTGGTGGSSGIGGSGGGVTGGTEAGSGGAQAGTGGAPFETVPCDQIPPSSQDCDAPLAPGDDRKCTIGANRSYYMYAPPTYNPCVASALVVDLHGAMETAEEHAGLDDVFSAFGADWPGEGSGWRLEADMEGGGFIVVTPQGIGNVWATTNGDPQLMLDIVAHIKTVANIDPDKVYISGISNGAGMSYQAGCPGSDVFSGIAPHAGGMNCTSIKKPMPVITFDAERDFAYASAVGASDTMVRLNNCDPIPNETWLIIDSNTTDAVCRNDPYDTDPTLVPCNTITKTSITESGIEPTVCKRYDGCDGGVAVVFCEVAPSTLHGTGDPMINDAHIIYGNATSLNTPSVAWRFFKEFWK
ncbi:MAG: hypothetical protein JXA30_09760 [Deltaproteobacteria bacterium]|nr:hypothetical protein [Deltaproteobacteria bacterium]